MARSHTDAKIEPVDRLQRGIDDAQTMRVVAATTTGLVREACRRHELRGAEAIVLGRALTAGCLLATLTKNEDERVRINMRGGGPVGTILVDSRGDGRVRGCLGRKLGDDIDAPMVDGRPSVTPFVGSEGMVVVTRDIGLEEEYQGTVAMESGEVDLDLEHYLNHSEQLPSAMVCEVVLDAERSVLRCAGVLCQTFPGADPGPIERIRDSFRSGSLRQLLRHDRSPAELMGFALMGDAFESIATVALEFVCNCGPKRARAVLSTLGADDIDALADEPGDTEVRCSFCGERYMMTPDDLHALARRLRLERS